MREVIEGINETKEREEGGRDGERVVLGIMNESKSSITRHVLLKVSFPLSFVGESVTDSRLLVLDPVSPRFGR